MVFDDVDVGSKVTFFYAKVCTTKPNSTLCMGKVSHYYDVVSISIVDFIDMQRNKNETIINQLHYLGKMTIISSYLKN